MRCEVQGCPPALDCPNEGEWQVHMIEVVSVDDIPISETLVVHCCLCDGHMQEIRNEQPTVHVGKLGWLHCEEKEDPCRLKQNQNKTLWRTFFGLVTLSIW